MKTDLSYGPERIFSSFPFPENYPDQLLEEIGKRYHEFRRGLMCQLWLGLTDVYNLFHAFDLNLARVIKVSKKSKDEADAGYYGILELRRLHVELDKAVLAAYGWSDLDLGYGFHEQEYLPENDRIRYTISPDARKEVLKRLLALNHERAAQEAAKATPPKNKRGKSKADENDGGLFD